MSKNEPDFVQISIHDKFKTLHHAPALSSDSWLVAEFLDDLDTAAALLPRIRLGGEFGSMAGDIVEESRFEVRVSLVAGYEIHNRDIMEEGTGPFTIDDLDWLTRRFNNEITDYRNWLLEPQKFFQEGTAKQWLQKYQDGSYITVEDGKRLKDRPDDYTIEKQVLDQGSPDGQLVWYHIRRSFEGDTGKFTRVLSNDETWV